MPCSWQFGEFRSERSSCSREDNNLVEDALILADIFKPLFCFFFMGNKVNTSKENKKYLVVNFKHFYTFLYFIQQLIIVNYPKKNA